MEPFKNIFDPKAVNVIAKHISLVGKKAFDQKTFKKIALKDLNKLELKDRVRQISKALKASLPQSYKKSISILIKSLASEKDVGDQSTYVTKPKEGIHGFMTWPLAQFVEDNGLEDFDTSFEAMHHMTKRFTAEFAIRPFLQKDHVYVYGKISSWIKDPSHHVRRLCSEGIRPNLPWGLDVKAIESNLVKNIKILNLLKDDPSEYVRTSVANHLKDISSMDTKMMIATCKKWLKGDVTKERKNLIRKACFNLLKRGHLDALKIHGYTPSDKLICKSIKVHEKDVKIGGSVKFSAKIENTGNKSKQVIVDYLVHYLKKNNTYSVKAFRLKDTVIDKKEALHLEKNISFKKISTRKYYKGKHFVGLQINGELTEKKSFQVS